MTALQLPETDLDRYPISPRTRGFLRGPLGHLIEGEAVAAADGATMPVYDPATGRVFARVAAGGPEDVERAVASARAAYEDGRWRDLAAPEKERILHRYVALLEAHRDILIDLDVLDGGIVRARSEGSVAGAVNTARYYAGWPTKLHGTVPASGPDMVIHEVREPIGVCGFITPWNGPSSTAAMVVLPLACGNSVVWKPAEQTPLTALFAARLLQEAGLPPGVLNVLQGDGATAGAGLVAHPEVDVIKFTGSVDTGRRIQAAAAPRLKRLNLELGGKSPHIVFQDANLPAAARAVADAVWNRSGQVCTAGARVLVAHSIHDAFLESVVAASRDLTVGSGFDPGTQIGPLISQAQLARVRRYVDVGQAEGARLALGGRACGQTGYFHEPTIFADVDNAMTIAREEIFGPVMAVIPFDSEAEAYAIANDNDYGLAAGVWTRDLARAHRATRRLKVGTVWVNTYQQVSAAVSYGGVKQSGYGRNFGMASLDDLTQLKSVWLNIADDAPASRP